MSVSQDDKEEIMTHMEAINNFLEDDDGVFSEETFDLYAQLEQALKNDLDMN